MFEKITPQEAAGHNGGPPKQTYYCEIRVAHGLPPWKIVWMLFFVGGLIRHHIFLEIAHLWEFQMKEIKNIIN